MCSVTTLIFPLDWKITQLSTSTAHILLQQKCDNKTSSTIFVVLTTIKIHNTSRLNRTVSKTKCRKSLLIKQKTYLLRTEKCVSMRFGKNRFDCIKHNDINSLYSNTVMYYALLIICKTKLF